MSLTENFRLRCPIGECKTIKVAAGTAMGGAITAGTLKVINNVLAIAFDNVAVNSSNNSLADSVWVVSAPKVDVLKTGHASAEAWLAGKGLHWNGTAVTVDDNWPRCGYALGSVGSTEVRGIMCFMGDSGKGY